MLDTREAIHDPVVREVFAEIEQELGFGMVPNVFRAMARRPAILRANWDKFRATLLDGEIPRTIKEMVGVVVSDRNQSDYAKLVHLHSLGVQGVQHAVLAAVVAGDYRHPGLAATTQAMLAFAAKAARDHASLTPADYADLYVAGLTEDEVYEVIATVDLFTAVNVYTNAVGVPIDGV
jgi:uncharacterized peroxidase-related enzyme